MLAGWPLTMALASLENEIWTATPFAVVGTMSPEENGRVRFELRTRVATSVNRLPPDELLPGRAVDRMLSPWRVGPLARAPIHGAGATCFAALPDARPLDEAETQVLARLGERIAELSQQAEPAAARERRLTRIDALSEMPRALSGALDLRDVFDQLSAIARRVLPHDSAFVMIISDDRRRVRLHALSVPADWRLPEEIENPYPHAMTDGWDFAVHHDLSADPVERDLAGSRAGLRSAIRLPFRLDGRVAGALVLSSFQPNQYHVTDVPIARRIADYVTLALSHQRLADEARDADAVRERAANLEMLDGLLKTLAGVLDVREVFDRVSAVCEKVMTHDAMSISIPHDDGQGWTLHVTTGYLSHIKTPFVMSAPTPRLLDSYWDFELVADMAAHAKYDGTPSVSSGMRALLSIPVWVERRLRATVNFYSRTPGHFTKDDVLVTRRIADHIALALSHQQLAEEARRNIELRAQTANLELLDELLAAITDAAEVSEMFDRISAIASKVLAHDGLCLVVVLADGERARRYVNAGYDAGHPSAIVPVIEVFKSPDIDHEIVDDLAQSKAPHDVIPFGFGFRSALRVPIWLDGRLAADLSFLSRSPATYAPRDVLIARRIADRIALGLRRERGLKAAVRADEADARATQLESRVRALTEELDARTGYRRVIGQSAAWKQVLTQATQVAATDTTVLLLGESGTGKEVVARFLHRASSRPDGPFVALNCAALPEQLLEAELFGYERGAFTGATQSKPGQLEQAGGGTLFLDEVGETSPQVQAKFLRVLQEREFQRLGGTRVLRTDARVVAATNRDLQQAMSRGQFREDLFYRLNVFAIHLPPLRERKDDVLPLSEAFLSEYGRSLGRPPAGISRDARKRLMDYHWPGNVRELRNILERAAILCDGGLITAEHLALNVLPAPSPKPAAAREVLPEVAPQAPLAPPPSSSSPASVGDLSAMERAMIEQALQNARFNKSKAAAALGLTRAQLYVRMRKHGLE
jgi:transcriptional regulator with GAF, ATPase, and Fis domain